jgi:hypothetical protein
MVVALLVGAAAGAKPNGPEAGAFQGEVKATFPGEMEVGEGGGRFRGVIGLHENELERAGRPIGLEETRFTGVVAGQQGRADDISL